MVKRWHDYSLGVVCSMAVGLYVVWPLFGIDELALISTLPNGGDVLQALSGFNQFVVNPWSYPIFFVGSFDYPAGMAIIFTDSFPLLALLAKVFGGEDVRGHHVLPLLLALNFVLQGIGCVYLYRAFGERSICLLLFLLIFCLTASDFLFRSGGHVTLATQGLILISIGIVVKARNKIYGGELRDGFFWTLISLAVLSISLLLHHFYLFCMATGLFYSAVLYAVFRLRKETILLVAIAVFYPLVAYCMMEVAGYFPSGVSAALSIADTGHFGLHSSNLASMITNNNSVSLGSLIGLTGDATGGQYEGNVYLGWGPLVILLATVASSGREWLSMLHRHWALTLVALGFWFFSLLDKVYASGALLIKVPIPEGLSRTILGTLHANGRFAWVIAYSLVFFSAIVLSRRWGGQRLFVGVVFLLASATMVVEGWRGVHDLANIWAAPKSISEQAIATWTRQRLTNVDRIFVYPSLRCRHPEGAKEWKWLLLIQYIGSLNGTATNEVYSARGTKNCEEEENEFNRIGLAEDNVAIILRRPTPAMENSSLFCEANEGMHFCLTSNKNLND